MDKLVTENLFLLEFLVDEINLEYNVLDNLRYFVGDTCVMFQFLDNAPFYIYEKDFYPRKCQPNDPNIMVKNGKSCLFSMKPKEAEGALKKFDVNVEIFKHPTNDLSKKLSIGKTEISVVNLFRTLVQLIIQGNSTITKTLKNNFKLKDKNEHFVGDISAYIRLTCFGKLIIADFQMDLGGVSIDMNTQESDYKFQYNKPQRPQYSKKKKSVETWTYSQQFHPKNSFSNQRSNKNIFSNNKPKTPALCESQPQFADVCAALNNQNPKEVRFPKENSYTSTNTSGLSCGDPSCCNCYPPPPCFANVYSQPPPRPLQNIVPLQVLSLRTNCKDKENPFQISLPKNTNKTGTQCLNIIPPTCTSPDGSKFTEISDPKKEMFIMRIKKKTEGERCPKDRLDLELKTPIPSLPPAELENRRCQYEKNDLPNDYLEKYYGKQLYNKIKNGLNPLSKVAKGFEI